MKFRGISVAGNNLVFGNGIVGYEENSLQRTFLIQFNGQILNQIEIYPDSLGQLCGYDSTGDEIYSNEITCEQRKAYDLLCKELRRKSYEEN